jgi:hypothetical protein
VRTRTADLYRVNAGTAKIRGGRPGQHALWVGVWVGNNSIVYLIRQGLLDSICSCIGHLSPAWFGFSCLLFDILISL